MLIKEIITEGPGEFFKNMGKTIKSKLPSSGSTEVKIAAKAIFNAVKKWADGQDIDLDQISPEVLRQCTVFPSEKEQTILNKAMKGHPAPKGIYSKKDLKEVILTFVKMYKTNSDDITNSDMPTTHVEVNTEKGRYTFTPGKGWSFKAPKTTGLGTPIPNDDGRIPKLNAAAKKQAEEI